MNRPRGFTLIELMIVVGIIAILAAIAIPSYSDYIRRSRITEAVSVLSGMRVKMEQYFQDNRTYAGACVSGTVAALPYFDSTSNFAFDCPTRSATNYVVRAQGQNSMTGFTYTLDDQNARATTAVPTGWILTSNCWVLKKDGSC
jgi:type IV pilus assembly protein PilE